MAKKNVVYNIEIDASATSAVKKVVKTVDNIEKKIKDVNSKGIKPIVSPTTLKSIDGLNKKLNKTKTSMGDLVSKIGLGLAAFGAFELGKGLVKGISDLEQTKVAFNVLTGSVEKGTATLKELDKFSDVTPFSTDSVRDAGKNLIAFGVKTENLTSTLQKIGDISSGTGKDFNELANIFGKAKIAGTLMGEDINQLTEAGIPIIGEFAKQLGVPESEIKKLASKGQISFAMLEKAFGDMTSGTGKFTDLMKKQSETLGGRWSTLTSQFRNMAIETGSKLLPVLKKIVSTFQSLLEWTMKNSDLIKNLATILGIAAAAYATISAGVAIYTTITAAAAAGTTILATATAALNALWLANPIGIVISALAAAAIGITILWKKSETFRGTIKGLWEVFKKLGDNLLDTIVPIFEGLADIWQGLKEGFSGEGFGKMGEGFKKIGKSILTFMLQPLLQVAKVFDAVTGTDLAGKLQKVTGMNDLLAGTGKAFTDKLQHEKNEAIIAKFQRETKKRQENMDDDAAGTDVDSGGTGTPPTKPLADVNANAVNGATSNVKNITLNLDSLQHIENQTINSGGEAGDVAKVLTEELLQAANDINQTGGR